MRVLLSLLIALSSSAFAKPETPVEISPILQVHQIFADQFVFELKDLPDLVERENKIAACVDSYVAKQSKSYSKIVQHNLYDLMRNFEKITKRVYGKKPEKDDIPYDEKIEALAKIQCETYNAIGALK